jgi:glycosyltransferase involved in cell wall biosynthesis
MSCDVTVIVPAYNSSSTLRRALDSVYNQSLPPREIIVVDDGSGDWEKSQSIATSYPDKIAVHFIHLNENQGPSTARNIGIISALGRYVAFLDSDDIWFREKLAIQYRLMTSLNLDFSMHRYCHDLTRSRYGSNRTKGSEVRDEVRSDRRDESSPPLLSPLSSWTPLLRNDSTNSVMVLRQKMVLYDVSLRRGEDFTLYMELLSERGCRGMYIRRVLAGGFKSTIGASGLSGDVKAMHDGRMAALKKLIDHGNIGMAQYLFGICTETVKYPIRALRVSLRA